MNSKEFYQTIEGVVKEKKISYMDAVVWYCNENDIDTATVGPLVSKNLKDKISIEAQTLNWLPKTGKLPI
tara:strand:- start:123 stop:332 length:210 start_codon:yes stop_codon:yes gene_type:complete